MRDPLRARIFLPLLFILLPIWAKAQVPQLPPGVQVQDLQQRKEELIKQGVPPEQIEEYLKQANSPPAANQSPQAAPADTLTTDSLTAPQQEAQKEQETEEDPDPEEVKDQEEEIQDLEPAIPPIYGHELFDTPDIQFQKAQSLLPPASYRIGPGDQFAITVWGQDNVTESLSVQPDGSIYTQTLGKVYVAGLTYERAQALIISRYKRFISRSSSIEVVLGQNRRTIHVNIVGMVNRPGTYEIAATTSAFNALFEAQGIQEIGSVREIYIKRNGRTAQVLDLYDYLIGGDDDPVFLENNDLILVPVQQKVVEIQGSVKRPQRYELTYEEDLNALLSFAGGLTYEALLSNAQIVRLGEVKEELIDFNLGAYLKEKKSLRLDDGDEVRIKSLRRGIKNWVEIEGAVNYPDTYEVLSGERLADLIDRAGGMLEDAFYDRGYIVRLMTPTELAYLPVSFSQALDTPLDSLSNPFLKRYDKILVFSLKDFTEEKTIQVTGEVRKAGAFPMSPNMTLKDLFYLAGGLKESADINHIELSTTITSQTSGDALSPTDEEEASVDSINILGGKIVKRIAIARDWENDNTLDTLLLSDYNHVKVYSRYDFTYDKQVIVEGAVNSPGTFTITPQTTLKDLFYQAGGLKETADGNYIDLYERLEIDKLDIRNNEQGLKNVNRISLEADWQESLLADTLKVRDLEKIHVYSKHDFVFLGEVQIKGLVRKPGTYQLRPNMSLKDLLFQAGGFQLEADHSQIELTRVIEKEDATGKIVPIIIEKQVIGTTQFWREDSTLDNVYINTYDQVFVRKNIDFEFQESVFIQGEVHIPGEYNKLAKDERLSSLVQRAGNYTNIADLKGAYMERVINGEVIEIAIRLDKALRRPGGRYDISLLKGDRLILPPRLEIVMVVGNVLQPGTAVQYEPGKQKFNYYVDLAGGFDAKTKRKRCTVRYPDGRFRRAKSFMGIISYPSIEQGCVINVARKPEKEKRSDEERNKLDMEEVVAGMTAILTVVLLIQRINP